MRNATKLRGYPYLEGYRNQAVRGWYHGFATGLIVGTLLVGVALIARALAVGL